MKGRALVLAVAVVSLTAGDQLVRGQRDVHRALEHAATAASHRRADALILKRLELPSEQTAKTMLNSAAHDAEFVEVPLGRDRIRTFVVYPERADKAPVVLVTANNQGLSDWVRAVGNQMARAGFIAVVPDLLSGVGPDGGDTDSFASREATAEAFARLSREEVARRTGAVRDYAIELPAADGTSASLAFSWGADGGSGIAAAVDSPAADKRMARFELTDRAWPSVLMFLREQTGNRFVPSLDLHAHMDHAAMAQEPGRGGRGGGGGGLTDKRDDLPANYVMAKRVVAQSPRRSEWVDIPVGTAKLHTWISYPQGNDRAPIVLVLHGASGPNDWVRGVGDQLAHDGFIALTLDLVSGLGPNGGNFDSFEFPDDVVKAQGQLGRDGILARIKAAREYGLKLPRSNGKSATLGFCGGGGNSFRAATEIPDLNAAVVFYGPPPEPAALGRIKAPVIGFYGANDVRITATVEPTAAAMRKQGKVYESHIYPGTTHAFLQFQDLGENTQATEDAWPRAIAFLRQNTN